MHRYIILILFAIAGNCLMIPQRAIAASHALQFKNSTCNKTFYFMTDINGQGLTNNGTNNSLKAGGPMCTGSWTCTGTGSAAPTTYYGTLKPGQTCTCSNWNYNGSGAANTGAGGIVCFRPNAPSKTTLCTDNTVPYFEVQGGTNPDITLIPNGCDNGVPTSGSPKAGWFPPKMTTTDMPAGTITATCNGTWDSPACASYCKGGTGNGCSAQPLLCKADKQGTNAPYCGNTQAAYAGLGAGVELSCGTTYPNPAGFPWRCQGTPTLGSAKFPNDCGYQTLKPFLQDPGASSKNTGVLGNRRTGVTSNRYQAYFWPFGTATINQSCPMNFHINSPQPACPVSNTIVVETIPLLRTDKEYPNCGGGSSSGSSSGGSSSGGSSSGGSSSGGSSSGGSSGGSSSGGPL